MNQAVRRIRAGAAREIALPLDNLSAHADYAEIFDWLRNFKRAADDHRHTRHKPAAADALRIASEKLGLDVLLGCGK